MYNTKSKTVFQSHFPSPSLSLCDAEKEFSFYEWKLKKQSDEYIEKFYPNL